MTRSPSAPTLRALAVACCGAMLGAIGPVHCEDPVGDAYVGHVSEREAVAASGADFPPIRGAILASIVHGVHEHPFLLVATRLSASDPWSLLDVVGLVRRPRAGVRFVVATAAVVAVGHFGPDERTTRAWLRLADGTGDVAERDDDAILAVAAVGDPAAATPARLEYLAADGSTVSAEDIEIVR